MAKITKLYQTKNLCYKRNVKHSPKGVMWHCTGADNPFLSRYVGEDDGIIGHNRNNNHWNTNTPGGRKVCVHAWIGYTKNKNTVATYQTLPFGIVGWHAGGKANYRGYIGFEMCEDGLRDSKYFNEVYKQGVELTAHICKTYNIPVNSRTVTDHSDGNKMGIASNHGDVKNWFRYHGKTMADVRRDVVKLLKDGNFNVNVSNSTTTSSLLQKGDKNTNVKILQMNLNGLGYGAGEVDSSFGPSTEKAVKAFQSKYNVAIDGLVGKDTAGKISEVVKKLQTDLKVLGFDSGAVDGIFGQATEYAVKSYQNSILIMMDGIAGKNTLVNIKNSLSKMNQVVEESKKSYKIQTGSFDIEEHARKRSKELKEQGIDNFIKIED